MASEDIIPPQELASIDDSIAAVFAKHQPMGRRSGRHLGRTDFQPKYKDLTASELVAVEKDDGNVTKTPITASRSRKRKSSGKTGTTPTEQLSKRARPSNLGEKEHQTRAGTSVARSLSSRNKTEPPKPLAAAGNPRKACNANSRGQKSSVEEASKESEATDGAPGVAHDFETLTTNADGAINTAHSQEREAIPSTGLGEYTPASFTGDTLVSENVADEAKPGASEMAQSLDNIKNTRMEHSAEHSNDKRPTLTERNGPNQAPVTPPLPSSMIIEADGSVSSPLSDVDETIIAKGPLPTEDGHAEEPAPVTSPLSRRSRRARKRPLRFGASVASGTIQEDVGWSSSKDRIAGVEAELETADDEAVKEHEGTEPSAAESRRAKQSSTTSGKRKLPASQPEADDTPSKSSKRRGRPISISRARREDKEGEVLLNPVVILKVTPNSLAGILNNTESAVQTSSADRAPPPKRIRKSSAAKTPKEKSTTANTPTRRPWGFKRAPASAQTGLPTPPNSGPESILDSASRRPSETPASEAIELDPKLLRISLKMTARQPIAEKPLPVGRPRVWAESRQALCETVPYFNMPQSGCHQNDEHVFSFLFDGCGHCREYLDSDVIIARAGGGMEQDSSGVMLQKRDHSMKESQVKSVMNDMELKNPLVIICGSKNNGVPCKMPHRYNVMGWYKPVAVWAEKTLGKDSKSWVTIKYRFELLGGSKPAWHAPEKELLTEEERQSVGPLETRSCAGCHQEHPMIYLEGWMCLNPDCEEFWKLENGREAPTGELHYHPAFILNRTKWGNEEKPSDEKPSVPDVGNAAGDNLTRINTRGLCCPVCGRCSQRSKFRGWTCDNVDCSYNSIPKHIPVTAAKLHNPMSTMGEGPSLTHDKYEKSKGVKLSVKYKFGWKLCEYTFEGIQGKLVHAVSNARINREPGFADDMFRDIQNQGDPEMDLHLERRRFGIERHSGEKPEVKLSVEKYPLNPSSAASQRQSSRLPDATVSNGMDRRSILAAVAEPWNDAVNSQTAREKKSSSEVASPKRLPQPQVVEEGDFMTAFSMNYGMPYKFVASGASLPFTGAPWLVRACRADLNWASQNFLDLKDHTDLNEELIFAYMEKQKIEYHDDGESGLGPRIATLSLGGKAKMQMRMKMKHYTGCSKQGILTAERPVPGGIDGEEMDQQRLAAWKELQKLKDTNKKLYEQRRKQIPVELGLYGNRTKTSKDLVTITLNHGDIVLMEGYEIQQYLEHRVEPESLLRFALTCRTVLPDHLQPHERPDYEVGEDEEQMSALRRMAERIEAEEASAAAQESA